MEIIKTHIDVNTNKELFKSTNILAAVTGFIGALLVGYYFGYSIVSKKWANPMTLVMCIVGALIVLFALILSALTSSAIKASKNTNMDSLSDFQDEFVFVQAFKGEEKVGESKIYYNTVKRYMVKKNYIFMQLQNNSIIAFTLSNELDEFLKTKIAKRTR